MMNVLSHRGVARGAVQMHNPHDEHTHEHIYEHTIPSFVESELVRLYAHLFSSMAQFSVYGNITDDVSTYVAQQDGNAQTLLLLRREGDCLRVLNEQIDISRPEIERFARHVFHVYRDVNRLRFHAIRAQLQECAFPHQQFTVSEDIVVSLPGAFEQYTGLLGKATRKNIKHHWSRLKRNFPEMEHTVHEKEAANEQQIRDIVNLNHARMAGKNKSSYIDPAETERIINLVKRCGTVSVISRGGQVCAGVICYRIGDNYFSLVNGHDPKYNDYRLGTLCFYQTIGACIARGGKEFHFMWGQYEYKYMLLGVQRDLHEIVLYRSLWQMLLNGGKVMRIAIQSRTRSIKFWLLQQTMSQKNHSTTARAAARLLSLYKSVREFSMGLLRSGRK